MSDHKSRNAQVLVIFCLLYSQQNHTLNYATLPHALGCRARLETLFNGFENGCMF